MDPPPKTERGPRSPVLIVGAHRSGTTATARTLALLGLQLGHRLDSHHEPKSLQRLHDEYLARAGASWHRPEPFLEQLKTPDGKRRCVEYLTEHVRNNFARTFGYRKNPRGLWRLMRRRFGVPWGWKEPRTTLFAECWLELYPQGRIIQVIRDPLAVALSIRRRELRFRESGDPPKDRLDDLDYCLRLALIYIEAGQRLAKLTPNYYALRFEELQSNPGPTLRILAKYCGLEPSETQLTNAAGEIRPSPPAFSPEEISASSMETLLSNYPAVRHLGYGPNVGG